MSKITKATFKSFMRKNEGNIVISEKSRFDGMVDCVMPTDNQDWTKLQPADHVHENNLGFRGVWLVGGGRDYFTEFDNGELKGIDVYNCCGHFIVAVKKG